MVSTAGRQKKNWCSERGHYRPERLRPGVPDGDITGPNGRSLVFPDGDITGQNGRGLVFPEGDMTGPSGRGLVFPDGDVTGLVSQHGFRRVGTVGF